MTNAPQAEEGVTLADLWHVFTKHIVAILAVVIVATLATGIITKIFVKTEYKATATLIINAKYMYEEPNNVNVSYDNAAITFGKNVMPTLASTISDTDVVRNIVNENAKTDSKIERVTRGSIKVSYTEENLLVSVSYTTITSKAAAAATATAISDAICEISNEIATDKEGNQKYDEKGRPVYKYPFANSVFSVQDPDESKVVASNNWKLYTIIAAVLALVVAYLVFFFF